MSVSGARACNYKSRVAYLLNAGVALAAVEGPSVLKRVAARLHHRIGCGILFAPARVSCAQSNACDHCEAAVGGMRKVFVCGDVVLFPAVELAVA